MLYDLGPLGCANRPWALVAATVGARGWLYEFPRDGSLPALADDMEPPVFGRAMVLAAFPNTPVESDIARGGSLDGRCIWLLLDGEPVVG